jgi:peptidoglycan/LPS O-acetylase OafA/YrhL
MSEQIADTRRIDCLESVRGLMALWVVIGHVLLTFNTPTLETNPVWRVFAENIRAVDIFIVLSGFVIFFLLSNRRESYGIYLYRRFMRIFPAYALCLIVSAAMLPLAIEAIRSLPETGRNAARLAYLLDSWDRLFLHLGAHLSMLHGVIPKALLPNTDYAVLGQAWSISLEWQFYIVAPLAFWLATLPRRWIGLAALAVLVLALLKFRGFFGAGYLGDHVLWFALGGASALFWVEELALQRWLARYANISIPLIVLAGVLFSRQYWHIALWIAVFLAASACRFQQIDTSVPSVLLRALGVAPLRWLGNISYSVYLVHMIPLFGTVWLLRDAGFSQPALMAITMGATLMFTLGAAAAMYRWVEMPAFSYAKRRVSRRKTAVVATAPLA